MSLRALIFDVDGTLAETEEAHRTAFNATFALHRPGWHWSRDDYRDLLGTTGGKERMRAHAAARAEALAEDEVAALHASKTETYVRRLARGEVPLRPGVAALVAAARRAGLLTAIATTTSRPNVDALVRSCWGEATDRVFDVVAAGDEVPRKKPAPDVYTLALDRLGLDAGAAIAFEDSRNGLLAAQGAGLRVVVTPSVYTAHEDFAAANWLIAGLENRHLPPEIRAALGLERAPLTIRTPA